MKFVTACSFVAGIILAIGLNYQPWVVGMAITVLAAACFVAMLYLADIYKDRFQNLSNRLNWQECLLQEKNKLCDAQAEQLSQKDEMQRIGVRIFILQRRACLNLRDGFLQALSDLSDRNRKIAVLESYPYDAQKPKIRIVRVPWNSGSRPSRTKRKGNKNKR